jgi:hypothetical protein
MKDNKIYLITADQYWPVGNAGAIVIAESRERAMTLVFELGLLNPSVTRCIGSSKLKEQVVFSNSTNY